MKLKLKDLVASDCGVSLFVVPDALLIVVILAIVLAVASCLFVVFVAVVFVVVVFVLVGVFFVLCRLCPCLCPCYRCHPLAVWLLPAGPGIFAISGICAVSAFGAVSGRGVSGFCVIFPMCAVSGICGSSGILGISGGRPTPPAQIHHRPPRRAARRTAQVLARPTPSINLVNTLGISAQLLAGPTPSINLVNLSGISGGRFTPGSNPPPDSPPAGQRRL